MRFNISCHASEALLFKLSREATTQISKWNNVNVHHLAHTRLQHCRSHAAFDRNLPPTEGSSEKSLYPSVLERQKPVWKRTVLYRSSAITSERRSLKPACSRSGIAALPARLVLTQGSHHLLPSLQFSRLKIAPVDC